jgi:hypothetical protein
MLNIGVILVGAEFSEDLKVVMRRLPHFKKKKSYATFCPVGSASFSVVGGQMSRVVVRCRREKIKRLLIDSTGLPEFLPPRVAERYSFVERIASNSASWVKIAHVASPEWVRSGRFYLLVARNRGLDARNFCSVSAALKWLLKDKRIKPAR